MNEKLFLLSTDSYEMENLKEKLFTLGNNRLITQYLVYVESLIKLKEDIEMDKAGSTSMDSKSTNLVYLFYNKQLPEKLIKGTDLLYIDGIKPGLIDLLGDLRRENYRNLLFVSDEDLTRDLLFPGHIYQQKNDYDQVYMQESGVAEEVFYDHLRSEYLEKEYITYNKQSDTISVDKTI